MAQRITVDIVAETAQLRAGLEQANQQLSGLQAGVSKINQVTTAVAGIGVASAGLAKATGFITKTTEAAGDLGESLNKSQVIFKDASKDIEAFAETAVDAIGASKRQALEGAATFGIFGNAAGLTGKDLSGFSTGLLKLAADLGSINNVDTDVAINALGAALRGESEPVRQFGILLNEDAIKAKALTLGLTKANVSVNKVALAQAKANKAAKAYADSIKKYGENSSEAAEKQALLEKANEDLSKVTSGISEKLTAQQKILAVNALLYEQGAYALDDFTNTGDSYANMQKKIEAQQENVNAEIGDVFLPIMQEVQKITKVVVDIFTALPGPLQTIIVAFGLLVATVGPMIILFNSLKTALVALEVAKLAAAAASGILTGATTLLSAAMAALPFLIVIGLIVLLVKNWDTVIEVVQKVWEKIKDFGEWIWPFIKGAFNKVIDVVKDTWDFIYNKIKDVAESVINWLKDNWPLILAVLTGPFGLFTKWLIDNKDEIIGKVSGIWNGIKDTVSNIGNATKDAATGIFNTLKDNLVTNTENTYTAITSGWNLIKGTLGDIVEIIKINLGTKFLEMFTTVVGWVSAIKTGVVDKFTELKDGALDAFNKLKDAASKVWNNIKDFVTDVAKKIKQNLSSVYVNMVEVGKDIGRGIIDGLFAIKNWFVDKLSRWVQDNIPKVVRDILKISSPSKVFENIGENIVQGLYGGLTGGNIPSVPSSKSTSPTVNNITINAGLGTNPYELGREVSNAIAKYGKVSAYAV